MADWKIGVCHEIWKVIPDFPGYEASNFGRIRSVDRWIKYSSGQNVFYHGKILSPLNLWNGYLTVHLGYKNINKYIHHLVAKAWLGPIPKGLDVCHNNNDKHFNWVINLRFDTRKGNMNDRPVKWVRIVDGVVDRIGRHK